MVCVRYILLVIVLICSLKSVIAQNDLPFNGEKLSSFTLYDAGQSENIHLPAAGNHKRFSLFIFLSPECPLSQSYLPLLNRLSTKYHNEIAFYGIIPGRTYSAQMITEFDSTYDVHFSLLIDSSKALTKYLQATVTPEIIFLNNENRLIYQGAVDDLLGELGKRRIKAAREYLKEAIAQSVANQPVLVKRTKAVGCKINDF